jgi:hypothetical protein
VRDELAIPSELAWLPTALAYVACAGKWPSSAPHLHPHGVLDAGESTGATLLRHCSQSRLLAEILHAKEGRFPRCSPVVLNRAYQRLTMAAAYLLLTCSEVSPEANTVLLPCCSQYCLAGRPNGDPSRSRRFGPRRADARTPKPV